MKSDSEGVVTAFTMQTSTRAWGIGAAAAAAVALWALATVPGCDGEDEASAGQRSHRTQGARASASAGGTRPKEPSGPPKRIFAKRFVVKVRNQPNDKAPRIGYLRAGAVLQATTAEPVGDEGCEGGWFELNTRGFVCNGRDVVAFGPDQKPAVRTEQPDRQAKLPYDYGFIRFDRTPIYRRMPTAEEAAEVERARARRRRRLDAERIGSATPERAETQQGATLASAATGDAATADAGPPTLDDLQADEDSVVRRWLMRGFYVSLDRKMERDGHEYWRTYQNGFVPDRAVVEVEGSDFLGVELGENISLPIGFAISDRARRYHLHEGDRISRASKQPDFHDHIDIVDTREIRGRRYYVSADNYAYRDTFVSKIEARDRPEDMASGEKWIDIDLSKQSLVAYEGDTPVFATLISSGVVKDEDNPEGNHETPTGTFHVKSKHLTHRMDGDTAIDGPYSIDDVPYVMFFEGAYAIHSAFWHRLFGRPKSHGCINISPHDAHWLFDWAEPPLPEEWHGVYPGEQRNGTRLVIHGETPAR